MAIAAVIQAHPSRKELWPRLIESLAPLPVLVSEHASDPPDPWAGYQRALMTGLSFGENPDHIFVIQDDTVICRNFAAALERIAATKPEDPVCLFLSWLPRQLAMDALHALKANERYIRVRSAKFCPVVAVLWPREAAERFLDWTETAKLPGYPGPVRSDDAVFGEWVRRRQETVWVTCPSLVEHPDNVMSIWGKRAQWGKDKGRIALSWIGDRDPLELDW